MRKRDPTWGPAGAGLGINPVNWRGPLVPSQTGVGFEPIPTLSIPTPTPPLTRGRVPLPHLLGHLIHAIITTHTYTHTPHTTHHTPHTTHHTPHTTQIHKYT